VSTIDVEPDSQLVVGFKSTTTQVLSSSNARSTGALLTQGTVASQILLAHQSGVSFNSSSA
jgi:hypothetical protein